MTHFIPYQIVFYIMAIMTISVIAEPQIPIRTNLGETKTFTGNNLKLEFSQNRGTILVTGNKNSVKMLENFGVVKVTGDDNIINIDESEGSVDYIGNNGIITFRTARRNSVSYIGDNPTIIAEHWT